MSVIADQPRSGLIDIIFTASTPQISAAPPPALR
jgi:hypothetical protein